MRTYLLLLAVLGCVSCTQRQSNAQTATLRNDGEDTSLGLSTTEKSGMSYDATTTLYFSHVFIYEFNKQGETGEFWIYHNPDTKQMLYIPEDPMVDFVVSDAQGYYYYFGDDGHGAKTVTRELVDVVANPARYENTSYPVSDQFLKIEKTGKTETDDRIHWNGQPVPLQNYLVTFQKVSGTQHVQLTEKIPVNFYQVYGFNKLSGDIQLPENALDFTGIFGKHQVITHIREDGFELALTAHESNPYYLSADDYNYFVQGRDGEWIQKKLPLLK